ncbi:MAG: radical SAM protein [Deltaproteobacteria bacterium]|jgi:molybdenum cofactor biosynthesis enzyme MoaA|nr:radical SAM protein [Deltaproteobacteria bacterium]
MSKQKTFLTVVADESGEVFEHPDLLMAGMNGMSARLPQEDELIPLPEGSRLFTIPGTPPIGFDRQTGKQTTLEELPQNWGGGSVQAVSAFVTPAFTRTLLPAAEYTKKAVELTLWSYTAVGWCVEEERFYVAAVRVDRNRQWEPQHFDDRKLEPLVRNRISNQPDNRLVEQLSRCALDYHCFAAKNLFFGRWEAPLPCSPACNAQCLGCISLQDEPKACQASQDRLTFVPTVKELCEVAVPHLQNAENAIVSFGQGCEGDPILQADRIAEAVKEMRRQTTRGTINFNSNASIPAAIDKLAEAGIDSIRISLNSVQESFYNAYYRPVNYCFDNVLESARRAKHHGLFTMLNYLVFPGITDREDELEKLMEFIEAVGIDMIQLRNLSIDPLLYWNSMKAEGAGIGMKKMLDRIKQDIPRIQYGYFNRTKENFYPAGFETDWPLPAFL